MAQYTKEKEKDFQVGNPSSTQSLTVPPLSSHPQYVPPPLSSKIGVNQASQSTYPYQTNYPTPSTGYPTNPPVSSNYPAGGFQSQSPYSGQQSYGQPALGQAGQLGLQVPGQFSGQSGVLGSHVPFGEENYSSSHTQSSQSNQTQENYTKHYGNLPPTSQGQYGQQTYPQKNY